MIEPYYSPWGKVQHCEELTQKVFSVSTASHGASWLMQEKQGGCTMNKFCYSIRTQKSTK